MRKPLLLAHMEAQQHLNNQIIVNQPNFKKDDDDSHGDHANETDENDIVYLSMNDDEFMDDDEFVSGRVSKTFFFSFFSIKKKKKKFLKENKNN